LENNKNNRGGLVAFEPTLGEWKNLIQEISSDDLYFKLAPGEWSLGQLFMHVIEESNYFLDQALSCLENDMYTDKSMTAEAEEMFAQNAFPDIRIKGDPANASKVEQPDHVHQIDLYWDRLAEKVSLVKEALATKKNLGKSQHPGLGFFSASEWFQFTEMHMRHHLRQKDRIITGLSNQKDSK